MHSLALSHTCTVSRLAAQAQSCAEPHIHSFAQSHTGTCSRCEGLAAAVCALSVWACPPGQPLAHGLRRLGTHTHIFRRTGTPTSCSSSSSSSSRPLCRDGRALPDMQCAPFLHRATILNSSCRAQLCRHAYSSLCMVSAPHTHALHSLPITHTPYGLFSTYTAFPAHHTHSAQSAQHTHTPCIVCTPHTPRVV